MTSIIHLVRVDNAWCCRSNARIRRLRRPGEFRHHGEDLTATLRFVHPEIERSRSLEIDAPPRWLVDRYYDPATAQFLSVDPDVAETGQPYAYTADDPLNSTDRLGLHRRHRTWHAGNAAAIAGIAGPSGWKFAQKKFGPRFSDTKDTPEAVRGKTVNEIAGQLENGALTPEDLPVGLGEVDGNTLIINARTAVALTKAGVPREDWFVQNQTDDPEAMSRLDNQLARNKLGPEGYSGIPAQSNPSPPSTEAGESNGDICACVDPGAGGGDPYGGDWDGGADPLGDA